MTATQALLEDIVDTWHISPLPEYRSFRCAVRQQQNNEAYYHWLDSARYYVPVHFCIACHSRLEGGELTVTAPATLPAAGHDFGSASNRAFRDIVDRWKPSDSGSVIAFYCDACGQALAIDPHDGQRKGYHVWWQHDGRWHELHFHKECGDAILTTRSAH